ncbi:MAG: AAA family ATPase [Deltaproteobacteria bacterium]|nr:AAA family ATPase [Deltaproteobacteria bacterium]
MRTKPPAKRRRSRVQPAITRVSVRGYKSIEDQCSVELRPLTILAGANSSGKSSLMQTLLLLKQTLEASYDPGALLLHGPNVRFTSADQLLSRKSARARVDRFTVGIETGGERDLTLSFGRRPKKGFEVLEMIYQDPPETTHLRPAMTHNEIVAQIKDLDAYRTSLANAEKATLEWTVLRTRCFLALALQPEGETSQLRFSPMFSRGEEFASEIRKIIHVPGLRGNPERTYQTTAVGTVFQGTFENYVASIVSHWQSTSDGRVEELGRALQTLGLTWKVDAKQVDDTQVELRVGRLAHAARGGAQDLVNIADVGFGVSQTLPVIVALLAAEPGQLVYLEQPEIHLHPRAQVALAQVLADAARRGVRVVAETHSASLLLGVQTLVAEGGLDPALVKLHWFTRREDGVTQVSSADLDEAGAFGDWPEDFGQVVLQAEDRYLDAAESRRRVG